MNGWACVQQAGIAHSVCVSFSFALKFDPIVNFDNTVEEKKKQTVKGNLGSNRPKTGRETKS